VLTHSPERDSSVLTADVGAMPTDAAEGSDSSGPRTGAGSISGSVSFQGSDLRHDDGGDCNEFESPPAKRDSPEPNSRKWVIRGWRLWRAGERVEES
jgi:hypothetical protein